MDGRERELVILPAQKQLEAYNKQDIDAFMSCYSADCTIEDGEGNIINQGHEAIRKTYQELFQESPELHCKLVSRIQVGNYVIDEENVTGLRGSHELRHVVAVYRVSNGLIEHVRFLK